MEAAKYLLQSSQSWAEKHAEHSTEQSAWKPTREGEPRDRPEYQFFQDKVQEHIRARTWKQVNGRLQPVCFWCGYAFTGLESDHKLWCSSRPSDA